MPQRTASSPIRLSTNLRELRGKRSLNELAAASGIHKGTLSRIERGMQLPTGAQVMAIRDAYGQLPVYTLSFTASVVA